MKILTNNAKTTGFVTFEHENLIGTAKIYDLPSQFGIKNGRVSKLCIDDKDTGNCVFKYDRDPQINKIGVKKRNEIVFLLEANIKGEE